MSGLLVFRTLKDAIAAGFEIYDRTTTGWLVRKLTPAGWAIALVVMVETSCHQLLNH